MDNLNSISLFSGAQGLDVGLAQTGIKMVIGQDIDRSCIKTILANGGYGLPGDIRGISSATILLHAKMRRGEPFIICGGPPCQPFSTAGKRLGINDPRGSLFMDFLRMIDEIRPRFFIMENVKGLLSSKLKGSDGKATNIRILDIILEAFSTLRYKTVYGLLDAVNYGVPQFRERFVMIGSRDNEKIFLPVPTHFHIHQNPAYRWVTLRQTINDLEYAPGECGTFSTSRMHYLKLIPQGGNWRDLPAGIQPQAMGGAYKSGGGKVGFYRRLSYDQPSPTLVTSPVQKATMLCHPTQNRPLSIAEYRRIQQFPDNWLILGSPQEQYRQIGNAVPVGLGKAIGEAVLSAITGHAEIKVKRMRGTAIHNRIQLAFAVGENN